MIVSPAGRSDIGGEDNEEDGEAFADVLFDIEVEAAIVEVRVGLDGLTSIRWIVV